MTRRRVIPARRGFSFLEVVAAAALLGVVAASLVGVTGFVATGQARQAQRLAAAELANRLILMYLDDPTDMPKGRAPIQYGPNLYRWEYVEQPITLIEAKPEGRDANRAQSPLDNNRFAEVTIRVWLSERSGGSAAFRGGAPSATLSRIFDPLALRNPDSGDNLLHNPQRMQEFMQRLGGFSGRSVGGKAGSGGAASPRGASGGGSVAPRTGGGQR
jgi:prepilin-type N-terminal cleavage/methylation domain-containing protein